MRTTFLVVTSLALSGLAGCAAEPAPEPSPERIQVVSADDKGGLVVRYTTPELSFVLEGREVDGVAHSRLLAPDGAVITELALGDVGRFGSDEMMAAIGETAARTTLDGDGIEYQLAVESMMPELTALGDGYIDAHIDLVLHQVLLLGAIGTGTVSEAPPCPEYLAHPDDQGYHTMADHPALENAPVDDDKLYLMICLEHDLACLECDHWYCGWNCEENLDCLGRCGGGC